MNGVELDFSQPDKPTDNAIVEAFNGRLRTECLNENWFLSLDDAREKIEDWRRCYNGERHHGALRNLTPETFAPTTPAAGGKVAKLTFHLVQKMGQSQRWWV